MKKNYLKIVILAFLLLQAITLKVSATTTAVFYNYSCDRNTQTFANVSQTFTAPYDGFITTIGAGIGTFCGSDVYGTILSTSTHTVDYGNLTYVQNCFYSLCADGNNMDYTTLPGNGFYVYAGQAVTISFSGSGGDMHYEGGILRMYLTGNQCTAPTITCPNNITQGNDAGQCHAVVTYAATVTGTLPTVTYSPASGSTFNVGTTTTVTATATNSCGTATCSFTVTVNDVEPPVISGCPGNVTVSNDNGNCSAVVSFTNPTASDNCGSSINYVPASMVLFNNTLYTLDGTNGVPPSGFQLGSNAELAAILANNANAFQGKNYYSTVSSNCCIVTTDATEVYGMNADCNSNGPFSANQPIFNGAGCNGANNHNSNQLSFFKGTPGTSISQTAGHPSGYAFPVGATVNTFIATDVHGNTSSCSFTVTVIDNQAPVIGACPSNIVQCNNHVATFATPTATDNCNSATVTCSPASGSTFGTGTTTVTCTATDAANNTAACTFTVTINTTPTINCPNSITQSNDAGQCGAVVTFAASATGTPTPTITYTQASGSSFPIGTTTVTATATNSCGTATCSFTVTVNDAEPPVISGCPGNFSVNNDANTCGAVVTFTAPTATDNCGSSISGSQTFSYTGNNQPWIVPAGVTSVSIIAYGASGVTACSSGGLGGKSLGNLTTTPGETLNIFVGQSGQLTDANHGGYSSNAFNGGGRGWTWFDMFGEGGGGGGASDVRQGGTALSNRVIVAGGGGGSQCNFCLGGDGGGLVGGSTSCYSTANGGTQSAGGTSSDDGISGSLGNGGDADGNITQGWVGGGGGGYYGGASGGDHSSGAGGSGYIGGVSSGSTTSGIQTGDGQVIISYIGSTGPTVSQTGGHPSGYVFPIGTTTNTFLATDAHSNTSTCSFTVTVTDNQAPTFYGNSNLDNAPALATSNVTEASQYQVVYQLDIPTNGGWGNSGVPYSIDHSSVSGVNFNRIAYFMQLDNRWVWVSMDKFSNTTTLTQLGIPNDVHNPEILQQVVNNMNIVGSAGSNVTNATGISGNVEMWTQCYGTTATLGGIGGDNNTYDFNDQVAGGGACYGSFQVHNWGAAQTIFDYNQWSGSGVSDLGIGNNTGNGNPDWTFMNNANTYTTRKLYILVSATPANITLAANASNCSRTNVTYNVSVTDNCGTPTVTYSPASGSTFNLGTTTVTATANDGNGNTATCSFTVTINNPVSASITETDASGIASNDGITCSGASATLNAGSYSSYAWTGGATTQSISVAPTSTTGYSVIVTNGNGCTGASNSTVTVNSNPSASSSQGSIACNGGTTTITVSASGGTPNYTGTGAYTSVSAGAHTYTVTDAKNCTASTSINVSQPTTITFTTVKTNVSGCNNITNNGSIAVTATGGTGTKLYSKDNGATYQGASLFTGLTANTYTVKVKDGNTCLSLPTANIIGTNSALNFTTIVVNATTCSLANGKITVLATGGSGYYNYSKDSGVTYQSSNLFNSVLHGTYKIRVKDVLGCLSSIVPVTVTCPGSRIDESLSQSNTFTVYPNPANDQVTILFSSDKEERYNIQLVDITGRIVINENRNSVVGGNQYQMNLSDVSKGVYLVVLQNSNGILQKKIVIN